jgi:glucosamine--fructose-6-phosphate aminotransferase (isomerizing)
MEKSIHETSQVAERQKQAVLKLVSELEPQIEQVITLELVERTARVYAVGCGDSYFASRGAQLFFDKRVGLPYEPVESMEFSRYAVETLPEESLVIGVSYGGKVSRTIEALQRARCRGAFTIAATAYTERGAALVADAILAAGLPGIRQAIDRQDEALAAKKLSPEKMFASLSQPGAVHTFAEALGIEGGMHLALVGMGAYLSSLLTLYFIGLRIGYLRGALSKDDVATLKNEILSFNDIQTETLAKNLETSRHLAKELKGMPYFLFLGSGPSYATANFSATKLFEQPHMVGIWQYVEEWAHIHLFSTRAEITPIFFIVPPGASRDRALEQMRGAKELGATLIAICDSEDDEILQLADYGMPVFGHLSEEFTPLVYIIPGQLFAFALLETRGQTPIPPPHTFQQMMEINYKLIYASEIWED